MHRKVLGQSFVVWSEGTEGNCSDILRQPLEPFTVALSHHHAAHEYLWAIRQRRP